MRQVLRTESDKDKIIGRIRSLDLSKPIEIRLDVYRQKRSLEQNSRLWALYREIRNQLWDATSQAVSEEELHEFFKGLFLSPRLLEVNGKIQRMAPTTTTLGKLEMADYQDKVTAYVTSEWGLSIWVDV